VAENEPVLTRELARADADACFESLCVLYVALTRARQGLYAITSYPGPKSEALTPAAILKQRLLADTSPTDGPRLTLGGETCLRLYAQGDWAWYRAIRRPPPRRAAAPPAAIPADFAARASTRRRLAAVEPSAREALVRKAAWLFDAESRRVLDFGTAIHALFEQVAWIETADAEAIVRDWLKTSADPEAVRRDAGEQFRRALGAAEVRGALGRPAGAAELWREKRFEIVFEDGAWVSGTFDRVTILRDGRGRAERAVILDYKSDRIEASQAAAAAEKYREQLDLYAQALARILKLDASAISRELLFTRPARVVRLC
jgi:ATP-dependent helicase/nuclease subunit A